MAVAEVPAAIDDRYFASFAAPKAALPYAITNVVPLDDKVGQARQSSMTCLLVDLKFVTSLPPSDAVYAAIKAVKDDFETSLSMEFEGYRFSVRHERPIYMPEIGATADEKLLNLGSTYRVWMTQLAD